MRQQLGGRCAARRVATDRGIGRSSLPAEACPMHPRKRTALGEFAMGRAQLAGLAFLMQQGSPSERLA